MLALEILKPELSESQDSKWKGLSYLGPTPWLVIGGEQVQRREACAVSLLTPHSQHFSHQVREFVVLFS